MRKDVRTGAAIGGVLLAALVVYAVVTHRHNKDSTKIVLDTGKSTSAVNSTGSVDQPAPASDAGSGSAASGHDGSIAATPPSDSSRANGGTSVRAKPFDDLQAGAGNDIPPVPLPAPESPKSASWTILLSADHVEDVMKPVHLVPVSRDENVANSATSSGDAGQRARRTFADNGTRSAPLTDSAGSGSSANAGGSTDTHPATSAAKTHRVVEGETFSSIARATYGDAKYFKEIIKANPNLDPAHLRPGTVIALPDKSQFKHDAAPTTGAASPDAPRRHPSPPASINPRTEYRVQANDNLYKISLKLYHTANRVDAIYQLNKSTIGPDPEKLKLDMVLKLPEPPAETASR